MATQTADAPKPAWMPQVRWGWWSLLLGVAVLYFLAARLGLALAFESSSVSAIWPPTGVAIAATLLLGRRAWPAVFLGAYAANALTTGWGALSIAIAVGNTLEALVGSFLIQGAAGGLDCFATPRRVFLFALCVAIAPMMSATVGVWALVAGKAAPLALAPDLWTTWWIGDAVGAVVVTPFLLAIVTHPAWRYDAARFREAMLMALAITIGGAVIFTGASRHYIGFSTPLAYLSIPLLVWAAYRFRQLGASSAVLLLSCLAIVGTLHAEGPFARFTQEVALLQLQAFIGISTVTALTISASADEKERAMEALRESNQHLEDRVHERTTALEASERRLAAFFRELPIPFSMTQEGRFVDVNDAFVATLGYTRDELLGRTSVEMGIMDPTSLQGLVKGISPQHAVTNQEARLHAKSGADVEVLTNLALLDLDGKATRAAVFIDITARKAWEEELQKARLAAEEAAKAKSQFLASMSHEIRTPMNAVLGMTQVLEDTPLTAEQKEYLHVIHVSGEHLLTLINDILDLSRMEAGKMELERTPTDLWEIAHESLELTAPKTSAKGIELIFHPNEGPHVVLSDPARLRQVLLNYLSNAAKFTAEGEIVLGLETAALPDGAVDIHLWVKDSGIGIPPDRFDRLFQNFSQVDASTTRRFGGTGLGLSISKRITEMMGGRVWVESVEGKGSTFHAAFTAAAAASLPTDESAWQQLSGKRVLVVDDNATNLFLINRQLQKHGMQVECSDRPVQALEWAQAGRRWDVAVLDFIMPGLDGGQLATALREIPGCKDMKIVLASSLGAPPDLAGAPVDVQVSKPYKPARLGMALLEALGLTPAVAAPRASMAPLPPLRILLAEDNVLNQKVAIELLRRLGQTVQVVPDGEQAVLAALREPYDLILMDVQMPNVDGYQATARIRAAQTQPRPRIVAMTAAAMAEDRDKALAAGMDDYLAKPVRLADLQAHLQRATPGQPAAKSPTAAAPTPVPMPPKPL